ncbi:MAG TPA: transporter [Devosiaceae bacterium]|jgi:hypothetical protein
MLLVPGAFAAEGGFSVYGLGGSAFNAGITPPAGTYVTPLAGYYQGVIEGNATVGGVPVRAGAEVGFFSTGVNLLYVPEAKFLNGTPGLSLTLPFGCVGLTASLSAGGPGVSRDVDGCGIGDFNVRAQVGWQHETFFVSPYVAVVLPTGKYNPGFSPSIGLHRPAIDTGIGLTWIEPNSKIQISATPGITFNFENTATQYTSGTEFHLDWAVGKTLDNGLTLGVVGYNYRQLTGDSGPGATLGAYKGSVDAVGLGLDYSTKINDVPTSISFRHYREFNAEHRFEGSTTLATMSFAF